MPKSVHSLATSALTSQNDITEQSLANYYQQRLLSIPDERVEFNVLMEGLAPSAEEDHYVSWEIEHEQQYEEKILESILKNHDDQIKTIRDEAEKFEIDTEEIWSRIRSDAKKIQKILAIHQPVHHDITFMKTIPEERVVEMPGGPDQYPDDGKRDYWGFLLTQEEIDRRQHAERRIKQMQRSLKEQFETLKADHSISQNEFRRRERATRVILEQLFKKLNNAEDTLLDMTREFLNLRYQTHVSHRSSLEERLNSLILRREVEKEIEKGKQEAHSYSREIREIMKREVDAHLREYEHQITLNENALGIILEQSQQVKNQAEKRIADLKERLREEEVKFKREKSRKNLAREGFARDILQMRDQLRLLSREKRENESNEQRTMRKREISKLKKQLKRLELRFAGR